MTPQPTTTLADAITGVETAGTAYGNAVTQTSNDQTAADAAQKKADDAKTVVVADKVNEDSAASGYVSALKTLGSVVQAQIDALTPPAPANP